MNGKLQQMVIGAAEYARERGWKDEGEESQEHRYEHVPTFHHEAELRSSEESDPELELEIQRDAYQNKHSNLEAHLRTFRQRGRGGFFTIALGIIGSLLFLYWLVL